MKDVFISIPGWDRYNPRPDRKAAKLQWFCIETRGDRDIAAQQSGNKSVVDVYAVRLRQALEDYVQSV